MTFPGKCRSRDVAREQFHAPHRRVRWRRQTGEEESKIGGRVEFHGTLHSALHFFCFGLTWKRDLESVILSQFSSSQHRVNLKRRCRRMWNFECGDLTEKPIVKSMVSRPLMSPGVVKVCKICRRNVLVCKGVKKSSGKHLAQELLNFNFLQFR